jgi:hypothetical protein
MNVHEEQKRDVLVLDEVNVQNPQPATDYSEEAIPERDPAYQLPAGTLHESQTVEYLPAAERLALARCLEQLGMNPTRAAMVASL